MEGSNGNELCVIKTLFSAHMLVGNASRGAIEVSGLRERTFGIEGGVNFFS